MLTLSGTGFGPGVDVLVGSNPCSIYSSNYTDITCSTTATVRSGVQPSTNLKIEIIFL